MKIPVTQELIDSLRHETDDENTSHFPCLTERAIVAILGYPVFVCAGYVSNEDSGRTGEIDLAGRAYQYAYDAHDWDAIKPGEFEYTPGDEAQA